jgi:glycerol kinase
MKYVLALDQGTTSSRAVLFDRAGSVVAQRSQELAQIYPRPGWVEHSCEDIWSSQINVATRVLQEAGAKPSDVAAVGVTNQRETTLAWNRQTGAPIANAIVWQDRRTAHACDEIKRAGRDAEIRDKTGLVVDAYFSATKLAWLLDNVPGAREMANGGELMFGTVDSFLIWRLSGRTVHVTDVSNASRTMLFNIHTLDWDEELLALFRVPRSMLPEVRSSSEGYGETADGILGLPGRIPIAGCAGDQQAATFGQTCFAFGQAKNTYGTGCFMLMNTGTRPVVSENNLLTTVGWQISGETTYCLEGSVFVAGAAIQYLRDELRIIAGAAESERIASAVESTGGVYFVPAFVGLGAPYWDQYARGAIVGLTRGSGRAEIVRAALESVAYQTRDLLDAMVRDCGASVPVLRVDGGMTPNDFLMQFQADILGIPVERAAVTETTALGAAYLAGLAVGVWGSPAELIAERGGRRFEPTMPESERERLYAGWRRAVERARGWEG